MTFDMTFDLFALSDHKIDPRHLKWIGILPDPSLVSVPNFKLVALKLFELCSSDPKIDRCDPKIDWLIR